MEDFKPHGHQEENLAQIREFFRTIFAVVWYLPTGGGKSFCAAFMLLRAAAQGYTCWFVVHRRELIRQTEKQFKQLGLDYGLICAGAREQLHKKIQICSINTLMRRIDRLPKPHLIVQDECHHLPCDSWSDVLKKAGAKYVVGLSATPVRLDGRGLNTHFGALVKGLSIRELIARGYLSPFRTFIPHKIDTSGLHTRAGEYIVSESEELIDKPSITGSAIDEYKKLCDGKRAIVFCVSIKHSKDVAAQFREAGYAAIHMDGTATDDVRDGIITEFESGKIQILCNVDLCGEGLSVNAIECVILLRPTQSLALYIQQVGRGLRMFPGKKELIILDHVGLTEKFGFIDEPREWSLDGITDKAKKKATSVKVCPKCFAALRPETRKCPECKHEFAQKPRHVEERDGELVEVTPEELAKRREKRQLAFEQSQATTPEALAEIFRRRGYKGDVLGRARHVIAARAAKARR